MKPWHGANSPNHGPGTPKEISRYNRQFAGVTGCCQTSNRRINRAHANQPNRIHWPGIIAAQAIYAATKLRIPDLLSSGPKSVAELAVGL